MGSNNKIYTDEFQDVVKAESDYIQKRRESINLKDKDFEELESKLATLQDPKSETKWKLEDGKVGLALSGGGIRSATFNLGLLQSLAKQKILLFCDYVSTVSGGGYIGSCLSSLLDNPEASVKKEKFPFWFEREEENDERKEVKWLRRNSKYLAPKTNLFSLDVWRMVGLYLSGLVLTNITTIAVTILLTYFFYLIVHTVQEPPQFAFTLFSLSLGSFVIMVIARWLAALRNLSYKGRRLRGRFQAVFALVAALCAVIGGLIMLALHLPELEKQTVGFISNLLKGGAAASAIGLLTGLIKSKNKFIQKIKNVVFRVCWVAAVPVVLALFVRFLWSTDAFEAQIFGVPSLILFALILIVISIFTNTNRISFHHFYRDRLSEAYIIKRVKKDDDDIIKSNESLTLNKLHSQKNGAPYHLINTTLNVPGSKNRYLRGCGAELFMFSKLYVGSDVTGFRKTENYEKGKTRLATAMAISGAAASPQMGQFSSPILTFILTLLNVRLNRFMPNPNPERKPFIKLWPYYFLKELFNKGDENDRLLNLSDGGHHENLGIYELLKRRCSVIIASDLGADPGFNFGDLGILLRKVRINLGIQIDVDLEEIRQDPDSKNTNKHFVIGTIEYPDAPAGLLIYIKSSIVGNEPEDLLAYRRKNPTFPDETTADQFFDEAQFESYRELGYLTGKAVFDQKP
jgi:hypothetical protein